MVDNTIALQLKSPQLESPLNRMARGLQLQAYKAQADTAQQDLATRNSLRTMMSAPGFDITDPKSAQAIMGADPKLGSQMVSGMAAVQDFGLKRAEAGRKTLANGLFGLLHDSSDGNIDNVATLLRAQGVPEDALNTTVASLKGLPLEQRANSVKQYIATDEGAREALKFTMGNWTERSDGANKWLEDLNPNSPSFGMRVSEAKLQASPDALLAASAAAADRNNRIQVEILKQSAPDIKVVGDKVMSIRRGEDGLPTQTEVPLAGGRDMGQTPTQVETKRDTDSMRVLLGSMMTEYGKLNAGGGIKSTTGKSGLENFMAGVRSGTVGQAAGSLFGTENAASRDKIERIKKQLLDTLGLTTARLNTMPELNLWLSSFGSTGEPVENSVKAYENMAATHNAKHPDFPLPPNIGGLVSPEAAANLPGGMAAPANSLIVTTPNGDTIEFPNQAAADAFRKEAKLP